MSKRAPFTRRKEKKPEYEEIPVIKPRKAPPDEDPEKPKIGTEGTRRRVIHPEDIQSHPKDILTRLTQERERPEVYLGQNTQTSFMKWLLGTLPSHQSL